MESMPAGDSGSLESFTSSSFTVNTQITMQIPVLWGSNSNYRTDCNQSCSSKFFLDYASHSLPKCQAVKLTPSLHFGICRYPLDKSLSSLYIVQYQFPNKTSPVDSDLSDGQCHPKFQQPEPEVQGRLLNLHISASADLISWLNVICLLLLSGLR